MGDNPVDYLTQCKNSICIPLRERFHNGKLISIKEEFDFNAALESVYPLISIICTYLPYNDLISVSAISEYWKKNVENEINKRKYPGWLQLYKGDSVFRIAKSSKYEYAEKFKGLLFYNYKKITLGRFVCVHKNEDIKKDTFYSHVESDIVKNQAIDFACISLQTIFNFGDPVKDFTSLYSWFNLPDIPNVRINYFYYFLDPKEKIDELIKDDEQLECMIVFGRRKPDKALKKMMSHINQKQSHLISLGGGIVWGINSNGKNSPKVHKSTDLFCIAFLQNLNAENEFYSASMVSQEMAFEDDLITLKNKAVLREHSVIFRFCCLGKEDSEIEDSLLRKYFPSATLVQLDVNGEIGCTRFPYADEQKHNKAKKHKKEGSLMHQFTSILVLISWGKIKK